MSSEIIPINHDHPGDEDTKVFHEIVLLPRQEKAVEMILAGKDDSEIAHKLGITRQTVNYWRNKDENFRAELAFRRLELWHAVKEEMAAMYTEALGVLRKNLKSEDVKIQMKAATQIVNLHDLKDNLINENKLYLKTMEQLKFLDETWELIMQYRREHPAPKKPEEDNRTLQEFIADMEKYQRPHKR